MLERTFIHVPGIGPKTEMNLWQRGIITWKHFLENKNVLFSPSRDAIAREVIETSVENIDNIYFFLNNLPSGEIWRIFERFKNKGVYLDIETSGLYHDVDEITIIGLYDGKTVKTFINGINLNEFESEIAPYELIITFNGSQFDLPFIRRQFVNISLPPAHIDLRFFLKKLGYTGGLKTIEKSFGLQREIEIDNMDGFDAVLLWREYQWGDKNALDRLIQYNTADTVNLKPLMECGYLEMKRSVVQGLGLRS